MTLGHCELRQIATTTFLHPTIAAEVLLHILASTAARTRLTIWFQAVLEAVITIATGGDGVFLFCDPLGEGAEDQPADYIGAGEHESDL